MAQLLVRDLDENVCQWLRECGSRHGRSMEDEARDVLTRTRITDIEAEKGYATRDLSWEPNPHFQALQTVPEDLAAHILERANRDHTTPADVIRTALEQYLKSA